MTSAAKTFRYKVGDIEVLPISDGSRTGPVAPGMVINAAIEDVNTRLQSLGMAKDQFTHYFTPVVIKSAGKTVLLDAGMGVGAAAQPGAVVGFMTENLKSVGIAPDDIDLVVISHFHADHVNGLLKPDGTSAFPKAPISVPEGEWKFWMDDQEMARAPAGRMQELFQNNRRVFGAIKSQIVTHRDGEQIVPGMTAKVTPGHSIGHTSYILQSGGDRLFLAQDTFNHPWISVHNPGWQLMFDQIPAMAEKTRREVLNWLATEKLAVQAYHFPFPGYARIEKDGDGYRWVPLS
jgi:glyoxylase-like metal-dependent hydrolase (beta-lactamase superfamily II)